jgi:histone-arginine methyltransferase CARM1
MGGQDAYSLVHRDSSAAKAMGSDSMDVQKEVQAKLLTFNAEELRWCPSASANGENSRIEICQSKDGSTRLTLGAQSLALSDLIVATALTATFVTLDIRRAGQFGLQFNDEASAKAFTEELSKRKASYERFGQYDTNSVQSYFQYYAKLGNQQNMLQDAVRTGLYRRSIVENPADFMGKSVMDIGAGSGILSFFAAQTGAKTVYAVEASSMGEVIRQLADANDFAGRGCTIEVINKALESIKDNEVPDKVDVLISEPIGTFLFNERMIETYLCARDRFLKPGGKMFPNIGDLCIAPFSDTMLHWEQQNKNGFWKNTSFYGVDLTAALKRCTKEHMSQPVVDYVNPDCLVAKHQTTRFDFMTISIESLHKIDMPFDFEINQPCLIHGIAGWFDAIFDGSESPIVLSTAPWCPGTHWYQIRFLLETPLAVNAGQHVEGYVRMEANDLQSYYVEVHMKIAGTNISSDAPRIDLKDPEYRFYSSPNAYCPPGTAGVFNQQSGQQQGAPPQVPPQVQGQEAAAMAQPMAPQVQAAAVSNGQPAATGTPPNQAPQQSGSPRNRKKFRSPQNGTARM